MHAVCAWCPQNGRPAADLGERAPLDDQRITHGICPACRAQLVKEMVAETSMQHGTLEVTR